MILLTNDSSIINKIIRPEFEHEKEYIVTLNLPLRNQFLKHMSDDVNIGDAVSKPCTLKQQQTPQVYSELFLSED